MSRQYAVDEVRRFSDFFDSLPKHEQEDYYGGRKSNITDYEFCWCKNKYTNFRDALDSEIPFGSTMSPIIKKEE